MRLPWSTDCLETQAPGDSLMGLSPSVFHRFPRDVMPYLQSPRCRAKEARQLILLELPEDTSVLGSYSSPVGGRDTLG